MTCSVRDVVVVLLFSCVLLGATWTSFLWWLLVCSFKLVLYVLPLLLPLGIILTFFPSVRHPFLDAVKTMSTSHSTRTAQQ